MQDAKGSSKHTFGFDLFIFSIQMRLSEGRPSAEWGWFALSEAVVLF